MARFYTSGNNSRGNQFTAQGGNTQAVHTRGWDAGVEVRAHPLNGMGDQPDVFDIYMTTGSNGHGQSVLIGTVISTDHGPEFVPDNARTPVQGA